MRDLKLDFFLGLDGHVPMRCTRAHAHHSHFRTARRVTRSTIASAGILPAQSLVKGEELNRLYFGDNLKWLSAAERIPDTSVDLAISMRRLIRTPTRAYRSFSAFCLEDYLKETSSIRKVVDNETSVVPRNCNRIVCPL